MTQPSSYDLQGTEPLTAYVADMSYFSGKLEAYLRYREIPYERRLVTVQTLLHEVYRHTRMMKVPVVRLPDGRWLKDTTPMIQWLERHLPDVGVFPADPVTRFLALLIEDYADEWCWRAALYWRWCFPESRRHLSFRIGHEVLADWPVPKAIAGWYYGSRQIRTYLTGDGLTKKTEPFIRSHYLDLLRAMESILSDRPFLLGDRPTIADFGLYGPMFRHYGLDPTPARVMRNEAPAVYAWLSRVWAARSGTASAVPELPGFDHPGWTYFMRDIATNYAPFLIRNAEAWRSGAARFDHETEAVTYPKLKTVHYRVYCLQMLQEAYAALSEDEQAQVQSHFEPFGGITLGEHVESGLVGELTLPIEPKAAPPSFFERMVLTATGTPWDLPQWVKPREK
ncbi:MAG: glutathione S-transferase family protein [Myxococcota bacterium]